MMDIDDDETPTYQRWEAVEMLGRMHERALRNLCLAAVADPSDAGGNGRKWHIVEAEEALDNYYELLGELRNWLAERAISLPLLDHIATLETALLTIIKSMNEYLPPSGGDKDRFISEVIGAVDNEGVFRALGGTSEGDSGMVNKALDKGK